MSSSSTEIDVNTMATEEPSDGINEIPVFGLDTYLFPAIHVTAVVSCSTSALISIVILVSLFRNMRGSFWQASVGERLIVYLAICDVGIGISHGCDHATTFALRDHMPEPTCSIMAFLLLEFALGQSLVVNIAALSAVIGIVKERKVYFGKYDWKLMVYAFGMPAVAGTIISGLGYTGATGGWCFLVQTNEVGKILNTMFIVVMILVFTTNAICYFIVFIKIRKIGKLMETFDKTSRESAVRTRRSAQNMLFIMLAYLLQWSLYVAFTLCEFFGRPNIGLMISVVAFTNLGGIFNAIAYTLIRRWSRSKSSNKADRTGVSLSVTSVTAISGVNQPEA